MSDLLDDRIAEARMHVLDNDAIGLPKLLELLHETHYYNEILIFTCRKCNPHG